MKSVIGSTIQTFEQENEEIWHLEKETEIEKKNRFLVGFLQTLISSKNFFWIFRLSRLITTQAFHNKSSNLL